MGCGIRRVFEEHPVRGDDEERVQDTDTPAITGARHGLRNTNWYHVTRDAHVPISTKKVGIEGVWHS